MPIKIKLHTNFSFNSLPSAEMVLPSNIDTILDLLRYIGTQMNFVFVDADGVELRRDVEVIVNGKEVWFYPGGLSTSLRDGDSVVISMMPLGGG